eukprot:3503497-Amphidinium_carterae.1
MIPFRSLLSVCIARSVSRSQPKCLWDIGLDCCTVSMEFNKKTPCRAHEVRSPCCAKGFASGSQQPASFSMFRKLGGTLTPLGTENESPMACPGWWYGSWPTITTRTASSG